MAVRTLQLLVLLLLPSHPGLRAETLYNGIVLPSLWPPRINLTNRTSLSEPWYSTPRLAALPRWSWTSAGSSSSTNTS